MTLLPPLLERPVAAPRRTVPALAFGRLQPAARPDYHRVYLSTDFHDGSSNLEAITRFRDVQDYVQANRRDLERANLLPPTQGLRSAIVKYGLGYPEPIEIQSIADIPYGYKDYQGLTLARLAGARRNHDLFIHVCDPGVGDARAGNNLAVHDRAILWTKEHGVLVGPNNDSLGLFIESLKRQGKQPDKDWKLFPIDVDKVRNLERRRLQDNGYNVPETFHARDVFAVIAAWIANGAKPEIFTDTKRLGAVDLKQSAFATTVQPLPTEIGKPTHFTVVRDRTFGNLKTNLTLTQQQVKALFDQHAVYSVRSNGHEPLEVPIQAFFGQVEPKKPLAYIGSTASPIPGARFIELAINLGNISEQLGIPSSPVEAFHRFNAPIDALHTLKIERIR